MNADVNQFLSQLDALREQQGDALALNDIKQLLIGINDEQMSALTDSIRVIAGKVNSFKLELHAGSPDEVTDKIPDASNQLSAIVESTENAANTIMDAAEKIQEEAMTLDSDAQQEAILEQVTAIFEASNFQDLTGQRVTKVVNVLIEIDEVVSELLTQLRQTLDIEVGSADGLAKQRNPEDDLLNGPQLKKDLPSQGDIDALFDSL